ncbi:MAG TPA: AAA family ATPase, partial [Blastocatellia bacterium]|nr:AAA family ATPase [Blastocatellia bacterium]
IELNKEAEKLDTLGQGLELLTETVSGISHADATVRTAIIESISTLYALLNQAKARTQQKLKNLGSSEALAQFGAQFKLLSQSVTNGLSMAVTPEKCDEQLSRVMNQLQELESQFGQHDQFLTDILAKREEVFETFESHKQQLLDERQRKAQSLHDAAKRIIDGVKRRALKFTTEDELNAFFATDPLVDKLRQMSLQLRQQGDTVKADDVEASLKAAKDQAVRGLRDKSDIFEEGGKIIKLGRHRFSVNTQELDLAVIPREGKLYFHLTGTEYFEAVENEIINSSKPVWDMTLASESPTVSRAEYLAYAVFKSAESGQEGLSIEKLRIGLQEKNGIIELLKPFTESRYKEGYERGIHDHDAAKILEKLIPVYISADLLRYSPTLRSLALLFLATASHQAEKLKQCQASAQAAINLFNTFGSHEALAAIINTLKQDLNSFCIDNGLRLPEEQLALTAEYLVYELAKPVLEPVISHAGQQLEEQLSLELKTLKMHAVFESALSAAGGIEKEYATAMQWLKGFTRQKNLADAEYYLPEAAALMVYKRRSTLKRVSVKSGRLDVVVEGLLSNHNTIQQGTLKLILDEFLTRLQQHDTVVIPMFKCFIEQKAKIIEDEKSRLKLNQFKPKPLTSFVRNKLINESYLPIVGDNLAKQMGTIGENKRSDLMGLLMLISPPGYGKTTLMEYVANRLGLIFMKINCPSLGHEVLSLDPGEAPNATAKQEVEKINLALEMGNNVMLYLDDIQHTHPEFLQKFISLCDATRRIDGVWKGITKTYDMRGKKFCVAMAGNPYTESGALFKIPDMLANRADIYNLGDVLSGTAEVFALSYIENAMTSNPVLAPLSTRSMEDFYLLVDAAKGKPLNDTALKHPYSAAEIKEIVETLKKLFEIQSVVLKVNLQYIASAAQDDRYRTEPPFKLQGSYRNMNKMAEKVSSVMTSAELHKLLDDHYKGE